MKALVTGGTGFAGKHLVNELKNNDYEVTVTALHESESTRTHLITADLVDPGQTNKIDFSVFDTVFHLAGLAAVGPSFNRAKEYLRANSEIQLNLFEACIKQGVKPKFIIISSANIYCADELPLTETSEVIPTSPYAVSKITQEYLSQYYGTRGFDFIIARAFNHMGPGQLEGFIVADFARQIAITEKEGAGIVRTGNLKARRDYTDVRDIVRGYRLLAEKGKSGEIYNVCSGKAISGQDILDGLLAHTKADIKVETDQKLFRPVDRVEVYGSNHKISGDTGWKIEIPLEQTLAETLDFWRQKLK
jgi:GDP-4-dehydro-6-deoxy-D-mannose reductase